MTPMPNNAQHGKRQALIRRLFEDSIAAKQATLVGMTPRLGAAADSTARIQEVHFLFIHCLCHLLQAHGRGDGRASTT